MARGLAEDEMKLQVQFRGEFEEKISRHFVAHLDELRVLLTCDDVAEARAMGSDDYFGGMEYLELFGQGHILRAEHLDGLIRKPLGNGVDDFLLVDDASPSASVFPRNE